MEKIIQTIVGSAVAIGSAAAFFIGANYWLNQLAVSRVRFRALTGAVLGGFVALVLVGNDVLSWVAGDTELSWALVVIGLTTGLLLGLVSATVNLRRVRLVATGSLGLILGVASSAFARRKGMPDLEAIAMVVWPVAGAVVFGGLARLRRRDIVPSAITGLALGWLVGTFGAPTLGDGPLIEFLLAAGVLGLLVGVRVGWADPHPQTGRAHEARASRAAIFLGPALLFISVALVIPALRTILLSFFDQRADNIIGLDNYRFIFTDPQIFNLSGWRSIFTSSLSIWGALLIVFGLILAAFSGRQVGVRTQFRPSSSALALLGGFLILTSVVFYLRGTIFNNLWWVLYVVVIASVLGLAIAVLADRSRGESVAKSIIFMPMAISFVGASVIWRFMYVARAGGNDQTGVLNALWVNLGLASYGDTTAGTVITLILIATILALAGLALIGWRHGRPNLMWGALVSLVPVGWFLYAFAGAGIGGATVDATGTVLSEPYLFFTDVPINNVWLMVVLIWIQTGFTMVIFSSAIKAVPAELIEASKVDGATESDSFWSIIVPQITPTVGVVVTTLIVLVMKVFDIVNVLTNGNFDTQVLANEMYQRAFTEFNIGLGAAVATVLFISVLPIMYVNIRRMQEDAS